jgi:hypothetical protein
MAFVSVVCSNFVANHAAHSHETVTPAHYHLLQRTIYNIPFMHVITPCSTILQLEAHACLCINSRTKHNTHPHEAGLRVFCCKLGHDLVHVLAGLAPWGPVVQDHLHV